MNITAIISKVKSFAEFCWTGVWRTTRKTPAIRIIKTLNLSVRSFLDRDLQVRACSLTYNTLLARVPALALLFAICRGFGFQNLLQDQLFSYLPSQRKAVETALSFVDSYLSQSSQGLFVGIGIVMLLWTLISLLSSIETAFNKIWDIKNDRSMYQKVTDYIAICLIIPVLMICSSGVSIFISTILQSSLNLPFLTPLVNVALEFFPVILCWLAFSLSFFLIPNTKVNFKYAMIGGALSAIGFQIVQQLILNGQIYVTKFNAIYGSFSFLPLVLVWLQISWLLMLTGCAVTYSLQNVFAYNYLGDVSNISHDYMRKVALVMMAVIARRFASGHKPLTRTQISNRYDLPVRLVSDLTARLHECSLISYVRIDSDNVGIAPARDMSTFTVEKFFLTLDSIGDYDFIPRFNHIYPEVVSTVNEWNSEAWADAGNMLLTEVPIPSEEEVKAAITASETDSE